MSIKRNLTVIIGALLVTSCAHSAGTDFNVDNVSAVKIGMTTPAQTIAALGEPFSRNISADGSEDWLYQRIDTIGSVNAKAFIPIVGPYLKDSSTLLFEKILRLSPRAENDKGN